MGIIMRYHFLTALALAASLAGFGGLNPATAQDTSVLKVARGLSSNGVSVLVNRAVVIESNQSFTEVSVAQPEIADVSPLSDRSIYIFGKTRGITTLTLLGENGQLITNVEINVMPDLAELKARLKVLLPKERVEVRTAGGGLVLSGTVTAKSAIDRAMSLAHAYAGDAVSNLMTVGGTQQVSLKVRIAEMSRTAAKSLGVSLGLGTKGSSNLGVGTGTTSGANLSNIANGTNPIFSIPASTLATPGFGTLNALFSITESVFLNLTIDALETKGFARTLAEPNIVARSGSEADFLAGGEVPIPTLDQDGNVNIEFKPIGVSLNFRPVVLDQELIDVSVSAEVSDVDPTISITANGLNVFGFKVRRATTNVQLKDGQSFAIAGLYNENYTDTVDQVPWIGDIPVLGTFFRSTDFEKGESELVIFVTVNLVAPVDSEDQLQSFDDRIRIPNEAELFILGRTAAGGKTPSNFAEVMGQGFDGAYGYVVE